MDVGTGWNQLVDVAVLSVVVIGELVGGNDGRHASRAGRDLIVPIVGLVLLWSLTTGFVVTLVPDVLDTVRGSVSYRVDPLAGLANRSTTVLSEDPYVPVSLGQVPVVLDPFMLPRLAERRPGAVEDLVRRIRRQEFQLVVLVVPLEPVDGSFWADEDFGSDVIHAVADAYRYAGRVQGYFVYVPREGDPAA
jgi:hypothetical protein